MQQALEIVKFKSSRGFYIKSSRGVRSAYIFLDDIEQLVLEDKDFTVYDPLNIHAERAALLSIIKKKESAIEGTKSCQVLTDIIRHGNLESYIKSLT